jgi:hypothetical protein
MLAKIAEKMLSRGKSQGCPRGILDLKFIFKFVDWKVHLSPSQWIMDMLYC